MLLQLLYERPVTFGGLASMKCKRCGHELDYREDAWPVEHKPDQWVELWVCPKCGEEEVA